MTASAEGPDCPVTLPVIDCCDDCGACCLQTPVPPFDPGEEVARGVTAAQQKPILERLAADEQFSDLPCVWFDVHSRRCRHYEQRPEACRRFEIGSRLCRLSRWDAGLE